MKKISTSEIFIRGEIIMKFTPKTHGSFTLLAALALLASAPPHANAGPEPFVGEINYVAFNFAPSGWAQCDGQLLPISQYQALFALVGTTYGGNGTTTFALPDMRGRVPVHQGQSSTGSNYPIGQISGANAITLTVGNMPTHNHPATAVSTSTSQVAAGASATSTLKAANTAGNTNTAEGNTIASSPTLTKIYSTTAPNVNMNAASIETSLSGVEVTTTTNTIVTVGNTGGSQPFSIMQPYTTVNCIIATNGIFPSRP
jgi:microcystin-dependent protein